MAVSQQPATADGNNSRFQCQKSLVEVTRGAITESRHRGHIVATEPDGQIVAFLRRPKPLLSYAPRQNRIKPFPSSSPALPIILASTSQIALACASHSGEPIHTEIAASITRRWPGTRSLALRCARAVQPRRHTRTTRARGEQPNVLQNNCSGKHAGMLAIAKFLERQRKLTIARTVRCNWQSQTSSAIFRHRSGEYFRGSRRVWGSGFWGHHESDGFDVRPTRRPAQHI